MRAVPGGPVATELKVQFGRAKKLTWLAAHGRCFRPRLCENPLVLTSRAALAAAQTINHHQASNERLIPNFEGVSILWRGIPAPDGCGVRKFYYHQR